MGDGKARVITVVFYLQGIYFFGIFSYNLMVYTMVYMKMKTMT